MIKSVDTKTKTHNGSAFSSSLVLNFCRGPKKPVFLAF